MKLDNWQREVLQTKGNMVLRSGRQVGKSTVVSLLAGDYAINNRKKTILVIASVERQAYLLFEKILAYLEFRYHKSILQGKDKPTKSRVKLSNGSIIYCLPTGLTGHGIRGYTIDLLIADEAAFIPEAVWGAVTPMLSTTKGRMVLLSTPFGKNSYFYKCFQDPSFSKFHVSSEDCPRIDKDFLRREKESMTRLQYAQEYLGEFVDDLMQYFSSDLVKQNITLSRNKSKFKAYKYFLGVDVARMGGDQSSYVVVEKTPNDIINVKDVLYSENKRTTHVLGQIKALHREWGFSKIYIDDGGLGAPIFDILLEDPETRRYVVGLNNARKSISKDNNSRRKIFKEDLYSNTLHLLEARKLKLIDDDELFRSLTSVQYEYTKEGDIKIFGKYTHICEGLIRACWCAKDKTLNIGISYF